MRDISQEIDLLQRQQTEVENQKLVIINEQDFLSSKVANTRRQNQTIKDIMAQFHTILQNQQ
jgi:hypothetical protein